MAAQNAEQYLLTMTLHRYLSLRKATALCLKRKREEETCHNVK